MVTCINFHDALDVKVILNTDIWEESLEPGDVLVWIVNDIKFSRGLESILKGVDDICDTNGEVTRVWNGNNKTESRGRNNHGGILSNIYTFDLGTPLAQWWEKYR